MDGAKGEQKLATLADVERLAHVTRDQMIEMERRILSTYHDTIGDKTEIIRLQFEKEIPEKIKKDREDNLSAHVDEILKARRNNWIEFVRRRATLLTAILLFALSAVNLWLAYKASPASSAATDARKSIQRLDGAIK